MTAKVYVDVLAVFSREGELIPKAFVWEDGHRYEIDKNLKTGTMCQPEGGRHEDIGYTCRSGGKICHHDV